jgi:lipopolysaccharide exporter
MPKKYAYWVQSGKYSLLQRVFVMLFGIFSFMLLARALNPDELGVWGLFLIISSIIETLRNALIRNGYVLFTHTRDEADHPGIEYAAVLTNIIYSLVFIALFLALGSFADKTFNSPGLGEILKYYCVVLIVLIPFSYLEIFFVTRMDFRAVFWMYFVRNGLMLAGIALFIFLKKVDINMVLLIIIYGVSATAGLITAIVFSMKHEKAIIKKDNKILPHFIGFGKYVFSNNLFSLIFRSTDSFMSASLISPVASAYYTTCARITNLVDVPSQVFGDIMFPKAAQVMKSNDREGLKRMYEKTVAATLAFTIPAILVIFLLPGFTLVVLAGNKYVEAVPVLQLVVFYGFFLPFIKQFGNIMDVLNRPQVNSLLMLIFAALNIGLNILAIKFFGIYGSAYATLLCYFLLFISTQIILTRILNISRISIFRNVIMFYPVYAKLVLGFLGKKKITEVAENKES